MCMCCDFAIYVNKFFCTVEIYNSVFHIFVASCILTLLEIVMTLAAVVGDFTEDTLSNIILYMAITALVYATLWAFICYKRLTADRLLITEYAFLMVPLPCISIAAYTLLSEGIFFPVNCAIQVIISVLFLYFSICIHTLYAEEFHKQQMAEEAAAA